MDIKYGKDIWNNLDYYRRLSNLTTYELSPSYAYLDWDKLPPEAQDKIATEMAKPSPLKRILVENRPPVALWELFDGRKVIISPEGEEPYTPTRWSDLITKYTKASRESVVENKIIGLL